MTRVRHAAARAVHEFFDQNGYYWVNTPIITASDAEGAGQMFRVSTLDLMNLPPYRQGRGRLCQGTFSAAETFLTVSGQLNVEAFCLAMSKVYTFGPTFRAENSNTTRHLAEFWMVEPEVAFTDLDGLATLAEDFLKFVFARVLERCGEDMAFFAERIESEAVTRLESLVNTDFVRMDYAEAVEILKNCGQSFEYKPEWGGGSADRARTLPDREALQGARRSDELPDRNQGVLYAPERWRRDGRGDGCSGSWNRRNHRRQASARSASMFLPAG